jgi:hypothetical protein
MEAGVFWDLGRVSDQQLRAGLATLLASGYRTEAHIIAHIAEVEERRIHAKDGSDYWRSETSAPLTSPSDSKRGAVRVGDSLESKGPARPRDARLSQNGTSSQACVTANRAPSSKADDLVGPAKPDKRNSA